MIKRDIETTISALLKGFSIITINGPRQSGKTTPAKSAFAHKPYFSLEEPDVRQMSPDDPRAFLGRLSEGAVIDEVQRSPEILSYLQTQVDANGRMSRYLLTGSQKFELMSGITQSLAGCSFSLKPHHENFSKRLIKSPKIYFFDSGLLCRLLGIQEPYQLIAHPLRGSIFETFIVSELVKTQLNRGHRPDFYFWRDSNKTEVDVIFDTGSGLQPIEIKSGQTLNRDFFLGLERWKSLAGNKAVAPTLIFGGKDTLEQKGIRIFGWNAVEHALTG